MKYDVDGEQLELMDANAEFYTTTISSIKKQDVWFISNPNVLNEI